MLGSGIDLGSSGIETTVSDLIKIYDREYCDLCVTCYVNDTQIVIRDTDNDK